MYNIYIINVVIVMSLYTVDVLNGTPKSVKIVDNILKDSENPLRFKDVVNQVNFSERTIRQAIFYLNRFDLIEKIPDYLDMRSYYLRPKN